MGLVGSRTERRDIPGEEGEWMEFRKLTGGELDEAEEVQQKRSLDMVKGLDSAAMSMLRTDTAPTPSPATSYDKDTLIRYGVVAWSYSDPCDGEHKKLLEADTRDWAAGVVVEMNVRPPVSASGSNGSLQPDESLLSSRSLMGSTPSE